MARINPWILAYEAKSYANADYSQCRLDCSLGVNLEPLPPAVLGAVQGLGEDVLKHYPHEDGILGALMEKFSPYAKLGEENFALGCGSIDLLYTLDKLFLAPGSVVAGFAPQFSAYVDDIHFNGAAYAAFPLPREAGYRLDAEAFAGYIRSVPGDLRLVYVDNPNNPTGQVLEPRAIEALVLAAGERDAAIVVDEAYGDFMPPAYSAARLLLKYDHLYVLKTMSKGYGMAGMRLGYLMGPAAGLAQFKKLIPPYNGSGLARALGSAMLRGGDYLADLLERTAAKNRRIYALLEKGPIKHAYTEEYTPISLFYVEDEAVDLCDVFRRAGVATVSGASFDNLGQNSIRVMVPREEDMPLLLELFDKAQKSLGK